MGGRLAVTALLILTLVLAGCGEDGRARGVVVTVSASSVGAEARVLRRQVARFMREHPGVRVVERPTPDAADQRHQLYVQWLNARASEPDVLQLDVIWTPEFAAAGWILPLDRFRPDVGGFFPGAIEANRLEGRLYALPWFIDVGMLYYRADLVARAPATVDELTTMAARAQREHGLPYGFVWQGQRYEGLVCNFVEQLGAFGGAVLDPRGRVVVDAEPAVRALTFLRDSIRASRVSPEAVTTWQEEDVRFAFQNGRAAFMRNWPYAHALLQDPRASRVAGRVAVAPMPAAEGGRPTAALGGSQLAINAHSRNPEAAWALVAYLTAPEQMLERAEVAGQYPARTAVYDDPRLARALSAPPADVRRIIEGARPRPVTPLYTELSALLQVRLHRALTGQQEPRAALADAAREMRHVLASRGSRGDARRDGGRSPVLFVAVALLALAVGVCASRRLRATTAAEAREARTAWLFVAPALACVALIAIVPLGWTLWESLHARDLRAPWLGAPFVALGNYAEALGDARFRAALGHTAFFAAVSVSIELALGLALALALNGAYRGRGLVRAAVLIPWAIPTVVAALVWRFLFDAQAGVASALLVRAGATERPVVWFAHEAAAWVPVILADVWKTTPFVALLLLAGLQNIDRALYDAARVDGANAWRQFAHVTLPALRPAIVVALLFRALDALRVFDLVYVLTGGGPGTATEPVTLLTFHALLQNLRFGYGAALGVMVFALAFALASVFVRALGSDLTDAGR